MHVAKGRIVDVEERLLPVRPIEALRQQVERDAVYLAVDLRTFHCRRHPMHVGNIVQRRRSQTFAVRIFIYNLLFPL
jgi:hypothetical protein